MAAAYSIGRLYDSMDDLVDNFQLSNIILRVHIALDSHKNRLSGKFAGDMGS